MKNGISRGGHDRLFWRQPGIPLAVVLFLTVLCYSNIFKNEFVCDDLAFIVNWPLIQDARNWPQFFGPENQPESERGVYSPLKTLVHSLSYQTFALDPFGYHVISILIHLAGTALVFLIVAQLTKNTALAFGASLIFGVHPVHVEAVTFITASVDTLGVVLMFASFYFWIIYFSERKFAYYAASVGLALLAIFTHELVIVLPLLFWWYAFCFVKEKYVWALSPFFVIAAVYVLLKWFVLEGIARGNYLLGSFYLTGLVTLKAFLRYLQIYLWPVHLPLNPELSPGIYAVDIQWFDRSEVLAQSFFDPQVLISVAVILIFFGAAVYFYRRNRVVTFAIGWFYLSLLPVSNIIPSESYFGQRYLYPGSLGLAILFAVCFLKCLQCKKKIIVVLSGIIFCAVVVFFMARTQVRNSDWKDNITFYEAEIRDTPSNTHLRVDLGVLYLEQGREREARGTVEGALKINPKDKDAFFVLGQIYENSGERPKAIESYRSAIAIDPQFAFAYFNLAKLLWLDNNKDEARENLKESIRHFSGSGQTEWAKMAEDIYHRYFP